MRGAFSSRPASTPKGSTPWSFCRQRKRHPPCVRGARLAVMTARVRFASAAHAFADVVARVPGDCWDRPGLGVWTVRSVVGHTVSCCATWSMPSTDPRSPSRSRRQRPTTRWPEPRNEPPPQGRIPENLPVREEHAGLDHPRAAHPRASRPLDLARRHQLHPATPGPPPRRRPPSALGTDPRAGQAHPGPRPPRISPTWRDHRHPGQPTEIRQARTWTTTRHPYRPPNPPPSDQEGRLTQVKGLIAS